MYRPNLVGKVHPEVEKTIRLLYDEIASLKAKPPTTADATLTAKIRNEISSSLVGDTLAQPLLGAVTPDPLLQTVSTTSGTVTEIDTTSPILGGPITSSGTISHDTSGVVAGAYTNSNITVDNKGHVTVAASGSAGGDASTNTSTSVDSEIALFSGTGGKTLKRATTTGILKATSGVIGAATSNTDYQAADQDLIDIAALAPAADDIMQRKSGAWTNRTLTQVRSDLAMGSITGWTDGTTRTVAAASTQYTYLLDTNTGAFNNTESNRQNVVPMDGTLSRLYIRTSSSQPGDGALTLTLRVAGADSSVVVTIAAASVAGIFSDITHSASVTAGQLVALKAVNASPGTASAGVFDVRLVFTRS